MNSLNHLERPEQPLITFNLPVDLSAESSSTLLKWLKVMCHAFEIEPSLISSIKKVVDTLIDKQNIAEPLVVVIEQGTLKLLNIVFEWVISKIEMSPHEIIYSDLCYVPMLSTINLDSPSKFVCFIEKLKYIFSIKSKGNVQHTHSCCSWEFVLEQIASNIGSSSNPGILGEPHKHNMLPLIIDHALAFGVHFNEFQLGMLNKKITKETYALIERSIVRN